MPPLSPKEFSHIFFLQSPQAITRSHTVTHMKYEETCNKPEPHDDSIEQLRHDRTSMLSSIFVLVLLFCFWVSFFFCLCFGYLILRFVDIIEAYLYVLSGSPTHLTDILYSSVLMFRSPHQTHRHTII
jgi:hypothetical protein